MGLPIGKFSRDHTDRLSRFRKIMGITVTRANQIVKAEKQPGFVTSVRHQIMQDWGQEMLELLRVEVKVQGDAVTDRPILFVGNHISYLDIPLLMAKVPVVFVAKKQLAAWPIFGKACRAAGVVMVNRDSKDSRSDTAEKVGKCIHEGKQSVALFPAGTTRLDESRPWRWGAFKIAQQYGIPVQPFRLSFNPLREAAFIDDDSFVPHLWRLLGEPKIQAKIHFHPPIQVEAPEADAEKWWRWSRSQS